MSGGDGAILAAIFVLFLASAVLALAETAFTKMNRIRALALEEEGRRNEWVWQLIRERTAPR